MSNHQEYISGLGKESVVPPEVKGWNWGAFLLNWIWGIGNSTFVALLIFIPIVNIFMLLVLGAKGNEWAWRNKRWRDVAHFKQTQRKWAISGLVIVFVILPLLFLLITNSLKGEAYAKSLYVVSSNSDVASLIGSPIKPSYFVWGNITTVGSKDKAELQYSLTGPKGEAEALVTAHKEAGIWVLDHIIVYSAKKNKQFNVIVPSK